MRCPREKEMSIVFRRKSEGTDGEDDVLIQLWKRAVKESEAAPWRPVRDAEQRYEAGIEH